MIVTPPQTWFDFLAQWHPGDEPEEIAILAEDQASAIEKLEIMGAVGYALTSEGAYA